MVHIVPTRRCNLACGYCNEYDKTSQPVPLDDMIERIDKLADLGTAMIAISGGEPLLRGKEASITGFVYWLPPRRFLTAEERLVVLPAEGARP